MIMLDANQQWSFPRAVVACKELASIHPMWIEEPTHPDDIDAHRRLAAMIAPVPLAIGEHVPNRVVFKNFLEAGCIGFVQPDCTRLGGVSEFLTVSLLARKFDVPVVPHVGDMGQIHQHLVLFNQLQWVTERFFEHILTSGTLCSPCAANRRSLPRRGNQAAVRSSVSGAGKASFWHLREVCVLATACCH
jgi:L-fuconate dehydratase